jgi:hypothetical protein
MTVRLFLDKSLLTTYPIHVEEVIHMPNKNNNQDQSVAQGIKETAGSAFHTVHSALETTENAAMNAVDATANAINNLTENMNKDNK